MLLLLSLLSSLGKPFKHSAGLPTSPVPVSTPIRLGVQGCSPGNYTAVFALSPSLKGSAELLHELGVTMGREDDSRLCGYILPPPLGLGDSIWVSLKLFPQ